MGVYTERCWDQHFVQLGKEVKRISYQRVQLSFPKDMVLVLRMMAYRPSLSVHPVL